MRQQWETRNSDDTVYQAMQSLEFVYDDGNQPFAMIYKHGQTTELYYYVLNAQGDVIALLNSAGALVASYNYGAWGNYSVHGADGKKTTDPTFIGHINPLRYRGYYYDRETRLYYLQSRYYDFANYRFINADGQLSITDFVDSNLFAYCGNDPVNRTDPTGEAWWHWALGALVVAGCAVATVVTCGGFAAAATAVGMVGCGVAAATTASTIAAGTFIGSATAYGMSAFAAAVNSNSVKEFNSRGNWGTVATTAGGAVFGGASGYVISTTNSYANTYVSRGSTGRTEPANLREKLAMAQVKSNPLAGEPITRITLNDPRWPASEGWIKMQQIVSTSYGNINIHYVYNQTLKIFDDFKFKP